MTIFRALSQTLYLEGTKYNDKNLERDQITQPGGRFYDVCVYYLLRVDLYL